MNRFIWSSKGKYLIQNIIYLFFSAERYIFLTLRIHFEIRLRLKYREKKSCSPFQQWRGYQLISLVVDIFWIDVLLIWFNDLTAMRVNSLNTEHIDRWTKILMVTQRRNKTIYGRDEFFLLIFSFFFSFRIKSKPWNFQNLFMDIHIHHKHTATQTCAHALYFNFLWFIFFFAPYGRASKLDNLQRYDILLLDHLRALTVLKINYDFFFSFLCRFYLDCGQLRRS